MSSEPCPDLGLAPDPDREREAVPLPSLLLPSPTAPEEGGNRAEVCRALALAPTRSHYLRVAWPGKLRLRPVSQRGGLSGATLAVITQAPESWPCGFPGTCGMHYASNHNTAKPSSNKELEGEMTQIRPVRAQQTGLRARPRPARSPPPRAPSGTPFPGTPVTRQPVFGDDVAQVYL